MHPTLTYMHTPRNRLAVLSNCSKKVLKDAMMQINEHFHRFALVFFSFHGSYKPPLFTGMFFPVEPAWHLSSPVGLVCCNAPAPLSLLVLGTFFLLPWIRVSGCHLFSTLTPRFPYFPCFPLSA